eukprot:341153-Pleurochrysis_carterae.AAC.1
MLLLLLGLYGWRRLAFPYSFANCGLAVMLNETWSRLRPSQQQTLRARSRSYLTYKSTDFVSQHTDGISPGGAALAPCQRQRRGPCGVPCRVGRGSDAWSGRRSRRASR